MTTRMNKGAFVVPAAERVRRQREAEAAARAQQEKRPVETEAYLLARANQHRKPRARRWLRANGYSL